MEEKSMHDWQSLSHVRWDCKYHVVIVPKYRKKVIYGKLKHRVGPILARTIGFLKGILVGRPPGNRVSIAR